MAMHLADYGATLTLTVVENDLAVDISTATVKQFKFVKPDNSTTVTKTATFTNSGSDGLLYYVIESGLIDQAGDWKVQAIVTFTSALYHSSVVNFTVDGNI